MYFVLKAYAIEHFVLKANPDKFIIRNLDIIIIRGNIEALKYSKCLSKIFPGYNYFSLNAPSRRSRSLMFFKIVVLKYFAIFTGKHLRWSLFSIMLSVFRPETLLKRDTNTDVFCEYCKHFKNNLRWLLLSFLDHFRWFAAFWIPHVSKNVTQLVKWLYVPFQAIVRL